MSRRRRRRRRTRRPRTPQRTLGPVAQALAPHRESLLTDSQRFATISLAFAQATAASDAGSAGPPPDVTRALVSWQQEVQRAQGSVEAVNPSAGGQGVALRWLKTLNLALAQLLESLSSATPQQAADAAKRARQSLDEAHALAESLDKGIA